ncbi:hypothetical protein CK203_098335 [Vitis vinifera]|uniref:Uncharacterized protein n=1 Tax=Vitis vinifera TaxID=29760 RepID=A0A438D2M9_VITVI|nr:hypothetical protein CK203_098335 [Vitis vinifera]
MLRPRVECGFQRGELDSSQCLDFWAISGLNRFLLHSLCDFVTILQQWGGGGGEEWDPCAKKQKHQQNKPRQRGLGVAKLEKILREQKDKEENKVAVAEFSSRLLSALPRQYQPPSSSFLCPVLPPVTAQPPMTMMSLSSSTTSAMHVPLTSTSVPFGPSPFTVPVLYGNAGMNSTSGVGVGGGSGVFGEPATAVPGCGCFPSSCESSLHGILGLNLIE